MSRIFFLQYYWLNQDSTYPDIHTCAMQEIIDEDTGEILCDNDNENCVLNPMKGVVGFLPPTLHPAPPGGERDYDLPDVCG